MSNILRTLLLSTNVLFIFYFFELLYSKDYFYIPNKLRLKCKVFKLRRKQVIIVLLKFVKIKTGIIYFKRQLNKKIVG